MLNFYLFIVKHTHTKKKMSIIIGKDGGCMFIYV